MIIEPTLAGLVDWHLPGGGCRTTRFPFPCSEGCLQDSEYKYLAIKNWEKYQKNKLGKVTANGDSVQYIKMWTDRDSDPDYSKLTGFQRYIIDGCCRLRGRFGRNLCNDPVWVSRALCIISVERHCMSRTIDVLVSSGFLILTNQQIGYKQVPLVEESRVEENIYPPISPLGGIEKMKITEPSYSEEFTSFWNAYPRKIGKGAAWKIFQKSGATKNLECVLKSIEAFKKTRQWQDTQFIPHPATWLNQRRWEDEPEKSGISWEDTE